MQNVEHEPLGKSEINTILAALRYIQRAKGKRFFCMPPEIRDIEIDGGTSPLLPEDIDALCEDINCRGIFLGAR